LNQVIQNLKKKRKSWTFGWITRRRCG